MAYGDNISRQAAIDALKIDMASLDHIIKGMSAYDVRLDAYVSQRNQVNCDIDTLNNLPTPQPEQLGTNLAEVDTEERAEERTETHACDYISRQQAIDEIDEWIKAFRENGHKESAADACLIQDGIIQLPPAQPQRMGKWILGDMCSVKGYWVTCSVCGHTSFGGGNFCRECGAKMGGNAE